MGYKGGYGIAVISYFQMAVLCYIGQNISDRVLNNFKYNPNLTIFHTFPHFSIQLAQNERLLDILYDFKWYLLPTNDQKDIMHMINRMQNGVDVTIGPFQKLNFETLKIVRKDPP